MTSPSRLTYQPRAPQQPRCARRSCSCSTAHRLQCHHNGRLIQIQRNLLCGRELEVGKHHVADGVGACNDAARLPTQGDTLGHALPARAAALCAAPKACLASSRQADTVDEHLHHRHRPAAKRDSPPPWCVRKTSQRDHIWPCFMLQIEIQARSGDTQDQDETGRVQETVPRARYWCQTAQECFSVVHQGEVKKAFSGATGASGGRQGNIPHVGENARQIPRTWQRWLQSCRHR